ncbi:hypothetical protein ACOTVT_08745 [Aliarcobacter butzleri]
MKHRKLSIFNKLEEIKPLDTVVTDNILQQVGDIKTQRVEQSIKEIIKSLISKNISPTKYKINKKTGIAFITINKYYQSILDEVKNEAIITVTI